MKHQFLILSYEKDFPWLWHCLRSVKRFARGYGVTIVVPRGQDLVPLEMISRLDLRGAEVCVDAEPEGLGQLFSQVTKCSADLFVPSNTKFVHFLDSDTIIPYPCVPELFMRDDRPVMPYNTYEALRRHGCGTAIWQPVVERNLGFAVANEFMRQSPMVYPIFLFQQLRNWIEQVHRKRFADYVFGTGKNSWPQDFCESNDLGAYAWERHHEAYYWMNLDNGAENGVERPQFIQFWSHGGFDRPVDKCFSPFKQYLVGQPLPEPHETPRQIITRILGWEEL